jgi:hypothetical protein
MNYFDSDLSNSTNMVAYFDWKTVNYFLNAMHPRSLHILFSLVFQFPVSIDKRKKLHQGYRFHKLLNHSQNVIVAVKILYINKSQHVDSWKPECFLSFNMGWRILVEIQFTNIGQPMLKLKTHSGFHELFRF